MSLRISRGIITTSFCLGLATCQANLVIVEAESGALGSSWVVSNNVTPVHISIGTTGGGYNPGSPARVAGYTISFPAAGVYNLYARLRVGPDAFNDDSLFFGNGFGTKTPTLNSDWVFVNGLASAGFSNPTDEVTEPGTLGAGMWKWVNLSRFAGQAGFTVPEGNLTQTLQIGGREDGLNLDKLAFGTAGIPFTVGDLDSGTVPGSNLNTNVFTGPEGITLKRFSSVAAGVNLDGAHPAAGLVYGQGMLLGTTSVGGPRGGGTGFAVSLDGHSFDSYRSFTNAPDAGAPAAEQVWSGNELIGTSLAGGANNTGAVFAGGTNGAGTLLRSFAAVHADFGTNVGGASPASALVPGEGGVLYGTTIAGGSSGNGTVFSIKTNGTAFEVLHNFTHLNYETGTNVDGAGPIGALVLRDGNLYGTASGGGGGGSGSVYKLATNGSGFTVLHRFPPLDPLTGTNADGAMPYGGVVISGDILYGATSAGGSGGQGSLYSIHLDGSNFRVLHHFAPLADGSSTNAEGAAPCAALLMSGANIFGTAARGGAGGVGSVFSFNIETGRLRVLHHLPPLSVGGTNTDGAFPVAPLIRIQNKLYGTAFGGGPGGSGTVFALPVPAEPAIIKNASFDPNGEIILQFAGEPNTTNLIESAPSLAAPVQWMTAGQSVADANGYWEFTHAINGPQRFFRSRTLE